MNTYTSFESVDVDTLLQDMRCECGRSMVRGDRVYGFRANPTSVVRFMRCGACADVAFNMRRAHVLATAE